MDMMPHVGDLSQATVPQACELESKADDVLPYGFLLAVDVDVRCVLVWVLVRMLAIVFVRAAKTFGGPSCLLRMR